MGEYKELIAIVLSLVALYVKTKNSATEIKSNNETESAKLSLRIDESKEAVVKDNHVTTEQMKAMFIDFSSKILERADRTDMRVTEMVHQLNRVARNTVWEQEVTTVKEPKDKL